MELHLHEWGDPGAPPVVCLHGVSAHGRRFRKLAEERLAKRFRVVAPDLRGHGFSGWEPPWTIATHAHDVLETLDAAGIRHAPFVGHSFGGRLILELAVLDAERIERAALLDPAIQILPHVSYDLAELERAERRFDSPEDALETRAADTSSPREFIEEEVREHLAPDGNGTYTYRYCRSAIVSIFGELCTPAPPPETLQVPTLLVHAEVFGLVRDEQLEAYRLALGDRVQITAVPGGHVVYWDAYAETADALDRFLGVS
ncbi:MAG: alpha/beta hydrolase [Actinobacteria bacterium]|nr:MAG: alpha/beta hydrolase [Actinomycetota bacterium]